MFDVRPFDASVTPMAWWLPGQSLSHFASSHVFLDDDALVALPNSRGFVTAGTLRSLAALTDAGILAEPPPTEIPSYLP